jgi:hypothetical protein
VYLSALTPKRYVDALEQSQLVPSQRANEGSQAR